MREILKAQSEGYEAAKFDSLNNRSAFNTTECPYNNKDMNLWRAWFVGYNQYVETVKNRISTNMELV